MDHQSPKELEANPSRSIVSSDAIKKRVRVMCDLFNLAFEMKSLELERKHPDATKEWIKQETLRLIELGTR